MRKHVAPTAGLALGLVSLVLFAGCGGDDAPIEPISTSSTTESTGTVAKDEFIVSADARCSEANAAIANLSDDSSATSIQQELSITQGLLDGLQGIGDGEDPDGSLANYYAALGDEIRILKQQVTAVNGGDTTTVASLDTELDSAKSDASDAADQYGFSDCGGSGTTLPEDGTTTTVDPGVTPTPAPTTPAPTTPVPPPVDPVAPVTPVDPGGTGGGTPTPPTTPAPPDDGGGSGGVGPG